MNSNIKKAAKAGRKVFVASLVSSSIVAFAMATPGHAGVQSPVSRSCSDVTAGDLTYDGPVIIIEVSDEDTEAVTTLGSKAKHDVIVVEGSVSIEQFEAGDLELVENLQKPELGTYYVEVGKGTYTVVFDYNPTVYNGSDDMLITAPGGQPDDAYYTVNLTCPSTTLPKAPNIPDVTAPLPKTGSGSSTSLLILAPAMMALGGGLVLARRRMVEA